MSTQELSATAPATRYKTKWYVTTDLSEARRLAEIEGTHLDQIETTPATPKHVDHRNHWALWSDGRITTSIGLDDGLRPVSLSTDAARLISSVWGSDSGRPAVGWDLLTQIAEIVSSRTVEEGRGPGSYQGPTIQHLRVRLVDGRRTDLWVYSVGYFEGYAFEIYPTRRDLDAGQA